MRRGHVFRRNAAYHGAIKSMMKGIILVITLSLASFAMCKSGQTLAEIAICAPRRTCKSLCWLEMPCPEGQQRYGDGSACSGGGKPNCDLGFCSNQPNGNMPSCPVALEAPATKSSDAAKQMLAMIGQNVQKITESYNEMKKDQAKATVDAAAAQMLFDSVASEAARLKQDMEMSQSDSVASEAKCLKDTNSLLTATISHDHAVATAKDTKVIDQELAVIQQLRQKLQELHDIKGVQTSNVQLDAGDSVSLALSDASAEMRPSTSLALAEIMADVGTGRRFAESEAISKLLEYASILFFVHAIGSLLVARDDPFYSQIVAKLNAERAQKLDDVVKASSAREIASTTKINGCNSATTAAARSAAATAALNIVSEKLKARTDELRAAKAEAARTSNALKDMKANLESESVSFAKMKEYLSSGTDSTWTTSKAALETEIKTLKAQLATCTARVATFEAAVKANSESENSKAIASGEIEDFAPQGLAGQVLVQAICVAIQKSSGWTFAVQRPCGNNQQTCEQVCKSENQAGDLQPFNAIHMYGNQATNKAGTPGLKTYRYNSGRGGGGCGPNYCCCGGGGAQTLLDVGDAASVGEFLEKAEVVSTGDNTDLAEQSSIEELANAFVGESDLEMEKMPAQSLAGVASTFEQFGAAGQILAQAACTAISPSGGYNFAIIKGCESRTDCSTLCALAGNQSGSPSEYLKCQDSLHLYQQTPSWNSRSQTDLKVYRYFSCEGGCGPNYCCCHGRGNFKLTDLEAEDDSEVEEDENSDSEIAVNELELPGKNFVSSTAAQVLAESACTAINSAGGWTFAIRRTSTDKHSCQDVCSQSSESQAGKLTCVDSLSIGGTNHPMVDDASRVKLGLMTYKHGNCIDMNANYCCCKNL